MKDILMIAHFVTLPWECGNSRFTYLAELLSNDNFSVEMVTSDFHHTTKSRRDISESQSNLLQYNITLLNEPGYPKNVCLQRLRSHRKFAKNLQKYLMKRQKPDVIYCAVPSTDVANIAADYCTRNNVKFVMDIQDLWPEAFKMVFHVPVLSNLIFSPMQKKANTAYKAADKIIAVSKTYAQRGISVNNKCKEPLVVYLGTDKEYFDKCAAVNSDNIDWHSDVAKKVANEIVKNGGNKIRLSYVGTLGSSYDLELIFEALRKVDETVLNKLEFIVIGDGPKMQQFVCNAQGLPVIFTGALPYEQMVWLLSRCDVAVNPIVAGSAGSIINKHMDYAMAGLPVINTQESEEYRDLINKYSSGINCACGNVFEVASAIKQLSCDIAVREEMGKRSRIMGEDLFDRKISYRKISELLGAI